MKLPIGWLKNYINVSLQPEKLAQLLTMSGTAVERVENKGNEAILDLEITTNRPDCLSLLGLAREVAALTGKKIQLPKISSDKSPRGVFSSELPKPKIIVEDKKGCPLYTARLLEGLSVKQAPLSIQQNLGSMGARPINNAVDATNFVLFEMGQPLHAFDYDKIKGGTVVVRRARRGEKFLGLDGMEYLLDEKILVIADLERPIAIAGVMGGQLTEVTERTQNILLESAYFDPVVVRQASRRLKLSTESSYRFERTVDPENVKAASSRARDLILEWAGGKEVGSITAVSSLKKSPSKAIRLEPDRVDSILGTPISNNRIRMILESLGFGVRPVKPAHFSVVVPSFRRDITQLEDLVEELLRIEGFEKIPVTIPDTRYAQKRFMDPKTPTILGLKKTLAAFGFQEIITCSLLSEKALMDSELGGLSGVQKIKNPVSAEQAFLRPTLLSGMLGAVLFNVHRKASSLRFFEIGNRYVNEREETVLSLGLYGHTEESWLKKSPATFFDLKGAVQNVLEALKCAPAEWVEERGSLPLDPSVSIRWKGETVAEAGILRGSVLQKWDIPKEVFYAELILSEKVLLTSNLSSVRVKPVPKFPKVRRDIAFIVDEKIPVRALEECMEKAGAPYVQEVALFDQYIGKNIPAHKRSLAFSLAYQKESGTFTDQEIQGVQNRVGETLKRQFQVEFR